MKSWHPIISAAFSYDHNQCRDWYDRWLSRGGSVARDSVYTIRAQDMQDLRSFNEQVMWRQMEGELRLRRLRMTPVSTEKPKVRNLRVVR
jgi:hypothetical protein